MRTVAFILFTASALAAPAFAAPAPRWSVDTAASRVGFIGSMNGQAFNGAFRRWDSRIAFDPKNLVGSSVVVVIDMASAVTGDASRDEALPTADWFSTALFPRATFTASSFKNLGGDRYQAFGYLTIRGIRRPVVLPFHLVIANGAAKMHGAITIDRRLFGVGQAQWATGDAVATAVQVNIAINARSHEAPAARQSR
jgi:polyisoprenoid-binding protein YceI